MNARLAQAFDDLRRALDRLGETQALNPKTNPVLIDGTIQRFEFTFELFWKTLKRLLEHEGIAATSPRAVLKEAYAQGWLDDEVLWLAMLRDRNLASHTYKEVLAAQIFENIRRYVPALNRTFAHLQALPR